MPEPNLNGLKTIPIESLLEALNQVCYFASHCKKCSTKRHIDSSFPPLEEKDPAYNNKQHLEHDVVDMYSHLKALCIWYGIEDGQNHLEKYYDLCLNKECNEGTKKADEIEKYFTKMIMDIKAAKKKDESQSDMG